MNIRGHCVGASSRWWEQECEKHVSSGNDYGAELLSSLAEEECIVRGSRRAVVVEKICKICRTTRTQRFECYCREFETDFDENNVGRSRKRF